MIAFFNFYILQLYGYYIFGKRVCVHGYFRIGNKNNITIGDNCGINSGVYILGRSKVSIGSNVILSVDVKIIDAGLDLINFVDTEYPVHTSSSIIIEDGVWIGAGSIILPGVTVGSKSVIAAGSVVTKSVPPGVVVAGNPARILRRLDQ